MCVAAASGAAIKGGNAASSRITLVSVSFIGWQVVPIRVILEKIRTVSNLDDVHYAVLIHHA